jgi:hypothetical protein
MRGISSSVGGRLLVVSDCGADVVDCWLLVARQPLVAERRQGSAQRQRQPHSVGSGTVDDAVVEVR